MSIYPWVDEIIIVDTGSTDRTPEICRSFGARMFEFPWCDDFSAARNGSLNYARGEWIFWMDSDDVISQEQGRKLRELVYGNHSPDCFGYVAQVHCESSEPGQLTIVDHIKVFRNLPELRFEHRIHEQILPAISRSGGNVVFTDIHVIHKGSIQTPEVRQRKLERDFRILAKDLEDRPDHPFVLFNLGMTHEDAGEYQLAEGFLRRSIEVAADGESHLGKTWALLANCLRQQGRTAEAITTISAALSQFPGDKELLFRRATLYQDAGQLNEAAADYDRVLHEAVDKVFQSVDRGITGFKARHNLALTLKDLDQLDEAAAQWQASISDCRPFSPAWNGLGRLHAQRGHWDSLRELLAVMPDDRCFQATRAILTAFELDSRNDGLGVQRVLELAWNGTGDPMRIRCAES
ncbi:MAG: glycosyltransferase [Planctomycetaceae bacterium]